MDNPAINSACRSPVLEVRGRRYEAADAGLAAAIAQIYRTPVRPRCLCRPGGIEMYVARRGDGYIVKRMPGTGSRHTPDCQSFELAPEVTGMDQLLGSAISEDVETGRTMLRLDFPLSRRLGQHRQDGAASAHDSAKGACSKLSLKGLLHYLWDQAELTRWHPGFEGKRSWGTVRRHLLHAANGKYTFGDALTRRLFIPEPFSKVTMADTAARRMAKWSKAKERPGSDQQLLLLVAEVKRIEPSRFGHRLVVKHLPDSAFGIEDSLYRALARKFPEELALWDASDTVRLIAAATFSISSAGVPKTSELCLMPVTREWLPIASFPEQRLISKLIAGRRSFIKMMHFGPKGNAEPASVVLTDRGDCMQPVFLDSLAT